MYAILWLDLGTVVLIVQSDHIPFSDLHPRMALGFLMNLIDHYIKQVSSRFSYSSEAFLMCQTILTFLYTYLL